MLLESSHAHRSVIHADPTCFSITLNTVLYVLTPQRAPCVMLALNKCSVFWILHDD